MALLAPLLVGLLVGCLFPFIDRFAYHDTIIPSFLRVFANFDGVHYLQIAEKGYTSTQFAFFPLYPVLIKLISFLLFHNLFYVGLFISLFSFTGFALFIKKYLALVGENNHTIFWFLLFLFSFPTSFFFVSIYSEGLFLFFFIAYLYFSHRKQWFLAFVFGYFAGLTRFVGLFLSFVNIGLFFQKEKRLPTSQLYSVCSSLAPILGFLSYGVYLFVKTGDFFAFFHTLPSFGEQRSSNIIFFPQVIYRYVKILITADHNTQYFIAILELVSFLFSVGILLYGMFLFMKKHEKNNHLFYALAPFSLINIFIPTLTGSLSSFPRYVLMSLFIYYILAKRVPYRLKLLLVFIFLIIKTVLFGLFARGYFIS